jgi:hypothetical protein
MIHLWPTASTLQCHAMYDDRTRMITTTSLLESSTISNTDPFLEMWGWIKIIFSYCDSVAIETSRQLHRRRDLVSRPEIGEMAEVLGVRRTSSEG